MKGFFKSKTVWTGIAALIGGTGGWAAGAIDPPTAIEGILGGLGMIFMRIGVSKSGPEGK